MKPNENSIGRTWYPPYVTSTLFATLVTDVSQHAWGAHFHTLKKRRTNDDVVNSENVQVALARGTLTAE